MPEWFVPQYSAQKRRYRPGLVALNHRCVYRPGSTSAFTRKSGTYRSWMTSCDVIVSFTDVPTGTCSSFTSAWPSGCWNFHIHCLPTT